MSNRNLVSPLDKTSDIAASLYHSHKDRCALQLYVGQIDTIIGRITERHISIGDRYKSDRPTGIDYRLIAEVLHTLRMSIRMRT